MTALKFYLQWFLNGNIEFEFSLTKCFNGSIFKEANNLKENTTLNFHSIFIFFSVTMISVTMFKGFGNNVNVFVFCLWCEVPFCQI